MKSFLTILLSAIFAVATFAQESEHMTFKGVPIDGTLSNFTQNIKTKGFSMVGQKGRTAIMTGTFAGNDDCILLVQTLDNKDLVYLVAVMFPSLDQWKLLNNQYMESKDMLTQKYGKPASCVEKFQRSYVNDDNMKLHCLKFDQCTYETIFAIDEGYVKLTISHEGVSKCFVLLGYVDGINGEKSVESTYDDL